MLRSLHFIWAGLGLLAAQSCEVPKDNTLTSVCFGQCAPPPPIDGTTIVGVPTCLILGSEDAKNGCTNQKDGTCTQNVGACTISCLQPMTSATNSTWSIRVGVPTRQDADVGQVQAIKDLDITPSTTTIRIAPRDAVKVPTSELRLSPTSFLQATNILSIDIECVLVTNFNTLPNLAKLKSLRLCNVGFANIGDVDGSAMPEGLDSLDLSLNQLRQLPAFVFRNKKLRALNMTGNPLTNVHVLATELQFLQSLPSYSGPVMAVTSVCQVGYISTKWETSTLCVQGNSANGANSGNANSLATAIAPPTPGPSPQEEASNKTTLVLIGIGCCVIVGVFVYLAIFVRRPRAGAGKASSFGGRGSRTSSAGDDGSSLHVMEGPATDKTYYAVHTERLPDVDSVDVLTPRSSSSRSTWTVLSFRSLFTEIVYPDLVVTDRPVVLAHDNFDMVRGKFKGKRVHVNRLKPMAHDRSFVFLSFLSTLRHPRLTSVVGVSWCKLDHATGGIQMDVVCEFMDAELLQTYLGSSAKAVESWRHGKIQIVLDVALGLMHIHEHSYVHANLSPATLLVDSARGCKLHTVALAHKTPFPTRNTLHVAPEVLAGEEVTVASDMFAFGVLLARIDSIATHWKTPSEIAFSPTCPEMIGQVAASCLHRDPRQRPSASFVYAMLRREASFIET